MEGLLKGDALSFGEHHNRRAIALLCCCSSRLAPFGTEQFAAREQAERKKHVQEHANDAPKARTVFLCFWDSVAPTATYMRVREESTVITGRAPLAVDAAFAGWHDARTLPGGFVDGEVVMVVPAAEYDDPPWPALVVDADGGRVPANVLALRDRQQRRALVQYFGDGTYGWVGARQLERVDALSSATRHAVRTVCARKKAWMHAFEEMQRALGDGTTDVHEALENMLREGKGKAHKRARHEGEEKAPKSTKEVPSVPEERKKAKTPEVEAAPPKKIKERAAPPPAPPKQPATKPATTKPATTSPRVAAAKPSKQMVLQKTKACAPPSKFMIVSTMEKHRGSCARKHEDDSSSEDEKAEEAPKKKVFAATTLTPSQAILCFTPP